MFRAKLGDFGFAIELPRVSGGQTLFSSQCMVRFEGYYPSEVTLGKYSDRCDVYSFGVVCNSKYAMQRYNLCTPFYIPIGSSGDVHRFKGI